MTPHFALRYDASPEIGMGHLKRCMTLANELQNHDFTPLHLIGKEAADQVRKAGVSDKHIRIVDGTSANLQAACTNVRHILTDICRAGNTMGTAFEIGAFARTNATVTVIDSMPPDHFTQSDGPAPDLVITPYLNAERYRPAPKAGRWVTGAKYAILGAEYQGATITNDIFGRHRILVTCGGSDPGDLSIRIAQRLITAELEADIVVGPLFSDAQTRALQTLAAEHANITLHHQPSSLARLIASSAYVIGRMGLTRYEAAALGRSGLYLSAGTSYRDYLEGFEAEGLARIFFDGDPTGTKDFFSAIDALNDPARQKALFRPNHKAMKLVDGNGAANVIEEILRSSAGGPK